MTTATAEAPRFRQSSNAYNIFILVLTLLSLGIMVLMVLPLDENTLTMLTVYDNFICVIFLIDFTLNLAAARPRSEYFIKRRGWLDLLGSIPTLGFLRITALFRLFRISRLARIYRVLGGSNRKAFIDDILHNRGQYALVITVLAAFTVLVVASVSVLQFEDRSPDANITTGGDALWWGIVTITTVGYGDYYPVTTLGRTTGVFVMVAGVGIIGALASILASILVPPPPESKPTEEASEAAAPAAGPEPSAATGASAMSPGTSASTDESLATELAGIKAELASLRALLTATGPPEAPG